RLSPQWFVKMKPLAGPAIAAVNDGRIKFYPQRWTKVYLDWMTNIRDWCISRQIWWGHRIPVYYCNGCMRNEQIPNPKSQTGIIVSKTRPEKCPTCGSTDIEQDPDVLDTWFSSWLWPFSTFGWPKETPELKYFYPTNSLVTAQEIIFFWVARMIMAGLEFRGGIPFKDVYIHGTVRDITGTKMSKSLGNVIDPLDVIAKYGTDALRFSIISITAQGQDVFLSEGKFELGRNFANKLWNASRFILMNLKPDEADSDLCVFFKEAKLSLAERWILSRFYSTLAFVTKCLDEYKFNEAANAIYEFVWHEFCDWYIEIAKTAIGEKSSQTILYKVLEKSLRMLHPIMPFVTEEIWQKLPRVTPGDDFIMTQPWPHLREEMISKEVEAGMKELIELVITIRNMRSVWNIDPQTAVKIIVNVREKDTEKLICENMELVKRMARVSGLDVGKAGRAANSAVSVVGKLEVYLPLEGLIDFEKEKARLKKEEERIGREIKAITGRLKDKNFTTKAPKEVVEKQALRKEELSMQLKKLKSSLREIGSPSAQE
ncbi:MAG: class I tRNA ligase family protein, partial [Candidatus Omnitrophica bacterium]|nr:class I tRNA ligase family protein [Candidatus Omnitrophota bacterium]